MNKKTIILIFTLLAIVLSFILSSHQDSIGYNTQDVFTWSQTEDVEQNEDLADAEDGKMTVSVQPESNEWWIQIRVTPGAKHLVVEYQGHKISTYSPEWDSSRQYFIGKPTHSAIPEGHTIKAHVTKLDGSKVTVSLPFSWRNGGSSTPTGGGSSELPGQEPGKKVYRGRATWYDAKAAGTPVCRFNTKYCGAPSDRVKGLGTVGPCGGGSGTCQNCERGYCDFPGCKAPQCEKGSCGRKVKIWCVDSQGCKTNKPVVMTINSMCPSKHPCNTCKGSRNPCARDDHFDLCEATFFAIANSQPSWEGLKIAYQPL